ncbi:MAG TPA: PIG-L family deacetylase [Actinospica sp.]|nr:PIG-L family deacetylase [Actinospica sp.]
MIGGAASGGAGRVALEELEPDPIQRPGTPERVWQEWGALNGLPALALEDVASAVVVAAHPDDEILGFGGALSVLADRGARLRIVVATDGEASHPASRATTASRLAAVRRAEDQASLAALGADGAEIVRLGLPDGGLDDGYRGLVARLRELTAGFQVCAAPWSGDVHPDHESAGRAALAACAGTDTESWHYPVWMWHWAVPGDERVPWQRAARIELPAWAWVRKQEAVACHGSQIFPLGPDPEDAPILPVSELEHFRRRYETVLR